jgi:HAD superfamily hydrolase (TIGR01450 family)
MTAIAGLGTVVPMHATPPAADPATTPRLRDALAGVRALVLDADGVLVLKGEVLPGAVEALAALEARGIPFRIATNFSGAHRATLAARFRRDGLQVPWERIVTAASATALHTAAAFAGQPLFVITKPDGRREFDGQHLMAYEDADAPGARAAAVVIGDGDADLSFANLDRAFRLIRGGAALLAMHRNPWWFTSRGPTLDSGAFVVALEFATGTQAVLCGKPGPIMFRTALAGLAADLGRRVAVREIAMVGDDPGQDIAGARRLGMRGILVLTGKTSAADAAGLLAVARPGTPVVRRSRAIPDAFAPSLAEVVAALD